MIMHSCQFLCVMLAILVSGCASWHKPSLVYGGRVPSVRQVVLEKSVTQYGVGVVFVTSDEDRTSNLLLEDAETVTPPIEGKAHRSNYRPRRSSNQIEMDHLARDREPLNPPPEHGYLELPSPPEMSPPEHARLGQRQ